MKQKIPSINDRARDLLIWVHERFPIQLVGPPRGQSYGLFEKPYITYFNGIEAPDWHPPPKPRIEDDCIEMTRARFMTWPEGTVLVWRNDLEVQTIEGLHRTRMRLHTATLAEMAVLVSVVGKRSTK